MTWFGGTVDGSFYWFDSQAVGMDQSVAKQSDFSATIKQSGRNDAIYADKPAELGGTWRNLANACIVIEWTRYRDY